MKITYCFVGLLLLLSLTTSSLAQIPRNIDSVKSIYEKKIAPSNSNGPKMRFSTEINGKPIRNTSKDYGYVNSGGKRSLFRLNSKNELWEMPAFESDSIELFFVGKKDSISSAPLKVAYITQGGSCYFGVVDRFQKLAERYDSDEVYHTLLNNEHRGLATILGSAQVRKAAGQVNRPYKVYYFVLQRGINETLSFHIK